MHRLLDLRDGLAHGLRDGRHVDPRALRAFCIEALGLLSTFRCCNCRRQLLVSKPAASTVVFDIQGLFELELDGPDDPANMCCVVSSLAFLPWPGVSTPQALASLDLHLCLQHLIHDVLHAGLHAREPLVLPGLEVHEAHAPTWSHSPR